MLHPMLLLTASHRHREQSGRAFETSHDEAGADTVNGVVCS